MTYLDGLKAAEVLCHERCKKFVQEARRWEAETDKASCLTSALESLECAIAIKDLIAKAERAPDALDTPPDTLDTLAGITLATHLGWISMRLPEGRSERNFAPNEARRLAVALTAAADAAEAT